MALSRLGASADFVALFNKSSHTATTSLPRNKAVQLHASAIRHYPEAPALALPINVSEIFNAETSRFAPERSRDLAAPCLLHIGSRASSSQQISSLNTFRQPGAHLDSYDCFGAVSLSGAMQTNVPKPFCSTGKSTHLNMPGGQWARDNKYIAEDMRRAHYNVHKMRSLKRLGGLDGAGLTLVIRNYATATKGGTGTASTSTTTTAPKSEKTPNPEVIMSQAEWMKLSKPQRLQAIIKDYGKTVIIFHVAISLASLGIFYGLVSSGLDLTPLVEFISGTSEEPDIVKEPGDKTFAQKVVGEGSTFVIAYAIHKLLAPARISITLVCTPVLVKYLRRKGILKPPKPSVAKTG